MKAAQRLILALDASDLDRVLDLGALAVRHGIRCKVGLETFAAGGPRLVDRLALLGAKVLLDLKLHDIPRTVEAAARLLVRPGVFALTVHALGGSAMMGACRRAVREEAARRGLEPPLVLAVTVLTSVDREVAREELGFADALPEQVLRLARLAKASELDGVVCSAAEAPAVRRCLGPGAVLVCPGIRPAGAAADDQKRRATPGEAIRSGADYLVVGRPVVKAPDPDAALRQLLQEIEEALRP